MRPRHEIYLETYIFEADRTGHRIAQALMRAARRRRHHVLIDGFGSSFSAELMQEMQDSGVACSSTPTSHVDAARERLRRMHRKSGDRCQGRIRRRHQHHDDMHTPRRNPALRLSVRVEAAAGRNLPVVTACGYW